MVGSKTAVRWALAVVLLAPLAAAASGGGPNSSGTCVAWMNASLDSAVLVAADLSEQTVVSSPTPLVFVGDEGELKASLTVTPSTAGPFASVRISLSGISFTTFAACATGTLPGNPAALSNLVVAFDEADESDGIEEVTAGQPVSLEIRLDVATGLESDGAGCITGNFVADPTPAFEAELEDDLDNEEDLEFSGAIVSLGASDFVVDVNGAQVTVLVDANTEFGDITGLGDLAAGDLVKVEADVQADGSYMATEVERLYDESVDTGATGRIACVNADSSADTLTLVFAPPVTDLPFPATSLEMKLSAATVFKVNRGKLNISGFSFNASNLSPGQRLTVAGLTVTGPTLQAGPGKPLALQANANKLILKLQEVEGTLVPGTVNSSTGTFQLNVASASGVLLSGPVLVDTAPMTRFGGGLRDVTSLNNTDTYAVKGLLMRSGPTRSEVTFIAKKVKKVGL